MEFNKKFKRNLDPELEEGIREKLATYFTYGMGFSAVAIGVVFLIGMAWNHTIYASQLAKVCESMGMEPNIIKTENNRILQFDCIDSDGYLFKIIG